MYSSKIALQLLEGLEHLLCDGLCCLYC